MPKKITRIIAIVLCFLLSFEQSGLAQVAGQLDISTHLLSLRNSLQQPEKFRPLHLRYLQYSTQENTFRLLLDKGDAPLNSTSSTNLTNSTKQLFNYFLIGLALPNETFWVNLRPDLSDNIIDPLLAQTDLGKILLEADVQLKKDTALATSPQTPEGKTYWDKLYKKAEELFGSENITIPTLTRPWIVPNEIIIRETPTNAYIYKATLKVMLEEDYLTNSANSTNAAIATYSFKDPRLKALNEYSSQLLRELIIPKLTKEVNNSKRYAPLRQAYYSLILAQWLKARFRSPNSANSTNAAIATNLFHLINSRNLTGLTSQDNWDKDTYFKQYQKSFKDGEYNIKTPVYTPFGQAIRTHFSGGVMLGGPDMTGAITQGAIAGNSARAVPRNKGIIEVEAQGADPTNISITVEDISEEPPAPAVARPQEILVLDGAEVLGSGGEGAVYKHPNDPNKAVKIFTRHNMGNNSIGVHRWMADNLRDWHIEALKKFYQALKEDPLLKDAVIDMEFARVQYGGEETWGIVMPLLEGPDLQNLFDFTPSYPELAGAVEGDKYFAVFDEAVRTMKRINEISQAMFGGHLVADDRHGFLGDELTFHNFKLVKIGTDKYRPVMFDPFVLARLVSAVAEANLQAGLSGLEDAPAEFVQALKALFDEAKEKFLLAEIDNRLRQAGITITPASLFSGLANTLLERGLLNIKPSALPARIALSLGLLLPFSKLFGPVSLKLTTPLTVTRSIPLNDQGRFKVIKKIVHKEVGKLKIGYAALSQGTEGRIKESDFIQAVSREIENKPLPAVTQQKIASPSRPGRLSGIKRILVTTLLLVTLALPIMGMGQTRTANPKQAPAAAVVDNTRASQEMPGIGAVGASASAQATSSKDSASVDKTQQYIFNNLPELREIYGAWERGEIKGGGRLVQQVGQLVAEKKFTLRDENGIKAYLVPIAGLKQNTGVEAYWGMPKFLNRAGSYTRFGFPLLVKPDWIRIVYIDNKLINNEGAVKRAFLEGSRNLGFRSDNFANLVTAIAIDVFLVALSAALSGLGFEALRKRLAKKTINSLLTKILPGNPDNSFLIDKLIRILEKYSFSGGGPVSSLAHTLYGNLEKSLVDNPALTIDLLKDIRDTIGFGEWDTRGFIFSYLLPKIFSISDRPLIDKFKKFLLNTNHYIYGWDDLINKFDTALAAFFTNNLKEILEAVNPEIAPYSEKIKGVFSALNKPIFLIKLIIGGSLNNLLIEADGNLLKAIKAYPELNEAFLFYLSRDPALFVNNLQEILEAYNPEIVPYLEEIKTMFAALGSPVLLIKPLIGGVLNNNLKISGKNIHALVKNTLLSETVAEDIKVAFIKSYCSSLAEWDEDLLRAIKSDAGLTNLFLSFFANNYFRGLRITKESFDTGNLGLVLKIFGLHEVFYNLDSLINGWNDLLERLNILPEVLSLDLKDLSFLQLLLETIVVETGLNAGMDAQIETTYPQLWQARDRLIPLLFDAKLPINLKRYLRILISLLPRNVGVGTGANERGTLRRLAVDAEAEQRRLPAAIQNEIQQRWANTGHSGNIHTAVHNSPGRSNLDLCNDIIKQFRSSGRLAWTYRNLLALRTALQKMYQPNMDNYQGEFQAYERNIFSSIPEEDRLEIRRDLDRLSGLTIDNKKFTAIITGLRETLRDRVIYRTGVDNNARITTYMFDLYLEGLQYQAFALQLERLGEVRDDNLDTALDLMRSLITALKQSDLWPEGADENITYSNLSLKLDEIKDRMRSVMDGLLGIMTIDGAKSSLSQRLKERTEVNQAFRQRLIAADVNQLGVEGVISEITASPIRESLLLLLDNLLGEIHSFVMPSLTLDFETEGAQDVSLVGGKAASLAELVKIIPGMAVKDGFVVTTDAYGRFIKENGLDDLIQELNLLSEQWRGGGIEEQKELEKRIKEKAAEIRTKIQQSGAPQWLRREVEERYRGLLRGKEDIGVFIRSSATSEDSQDASSAGQHKTEPNLKGIDNVLEGIKSCWASLFNDEAVFYRLKREAFRHAEARLAVVILPTIDAQSAGVVFTVHPATGAEEIFIEASLGLGESVVSGSVTPDIYRVLNAGEIIKKLGDKAQKIIPKGTGGVEVVDTSPEEKENFALSDEQVRELEKAAQEIEAHCRKAFGWKYIDIEFAFERDTGKLYILQARPETAWSKSGVEEKRVPPTGPPDSKVENKEIFNAGEAAWPGQLSGRIRVIEDINNPPEINKGDILVLRSPDPRWTPLLIRAGGIITEAGGLTSHAAIVSKEENIPCIVQAKGAIKFFRGLEGEIVTLDAANHRVFEVAPEPSGDLATGTQFLGAGFNPFVIIASLFSRKSYNAYFRPDGSTNWRMFWQDIKDGLTRVKVLIFPKTESSIPEARQDVGSVAVPPAKSEKRLLEKISAIYAKILRKEFGRDAFYSSKYGIFAPSDIESVFDILKRIGLSAGAKFVDLGAGDCRTAVIAAALFGAKGIAIERDPRILKTAKKALQELEAKGIIKSGMVELIEGDLLDYPLGDADVIFYYEGSMLSRAAAVEDKILQEASNSDTQVILYGYTGEGGGFERLAPQFDYEALDPIRVYRVPPKPENNSIVPPQSEPGGIDSPTGPSVNRTSRESATVSVSLIEHPGQHYSLEASENLGRMLEKLNIPQGAVVLNIGSGANPLILSGYQVINVEKDETVSSHSGAGFDTLNADFFANDFWDKLQAKFAIQGKPIVVLFYNMWFFMEFYRPHPGLGAAESLKVYIQRAKELMPEGGNILFVDFMPLDGVRRDDRTDANIIPQARKVMARGSLVEGVTVLNSQENNLPVACAAKIRGAVSPSSPSTPEQQQNPGGPGGANSPQDNPGGIDFRGMRIVTQPMQGQLPLKAGIGIVAPGARLNFVDFAPGATGAVTVPNTDLEQEWLQIQNMLKAGIIPSSQRLKEYLESCCQQPETVDKEIDKVLSCIADILRIEEENVTATDPSLRAFLIALEANKPPQELQANLTQIIFTAK